MVQVSSFSGVSVYLVEPSATQARLVEQMLLRAGASRVDVFASQEATLAALREARPAVVVSSLYLPDGTGTALVAAMRAEEGLETVPFVLISSETRPQVLDPVRQSGACCILEKPFDDERLARALRAVLSFDSHHEVLSLDVETLRVLLVDDSPMARRHIRRMLESLGIERILEAENGREAIGLLAETMVDLVVTDYNMPEMDGKALTEYIRTQSWQNAVPVLMVTSEQDQGRLAAVERAGVSAVCDKPFEPATVRRLIEQVMAA